MNVSLRLHELFLAVHLCCLSIAYCVVCHLYVVLCLALAGCLRIDRVFQVRDSAAIVAHQLHNLPPLRARFAAGEA